MFDSPAACPNSTSTPCSKKRRALLRRPCDPLVCITVDHASQVREENHLRTSIQAVPCTSVPGAIYPNHNTLHCFWGAGAKCMVWAFCAATVEKGLAHNFKNSRCRTKRTTKDETGAKRVIALRYTATRNAFLKIAKTTESKPEHMPLHTALAERKS